MRGVKSFVWISSIFLKHSQHADVKRGEIHWLLLRHLQGHADVFGGQVTSAGRESKKIWGLNDDLGP